VAGPKLGAIRLDSGDLVEEARRARKLLDELGGDRTKIVASGDLDEYEIAKLKDAPIDAFGVGTSVVTGSGAPTANFIYKLVARAESPGADAPLIPVEKHSVGKATLGGRKYAWRLLDADGRAEVELIATEPDPPVERHRQLQHDLVRNGEVIERRTLDEIRNEHAVARAELPPEGLDLNEGPPAVEVRPKGSES
jgi:nicotinate phosphoribosyltransferase